MIDPIKFSAPEKSKSEDESVEANESVETDKSEPEKKKRTTDQTCLLYTSPSPRD